MQRCLPVAGPCTCSAHCPSSLLVQGSVLTLCCACRYVISLSNTVSGEGRARARNCHEVVLCTTAMHVMNPTGMCLYRQANAAPSPHCITRAILLYNRSAVVPSLPNTEVRWRHTTRDSCVCVCLLPMRPRCGMHCGSTHRHSLRLHCVECSRTRPPSLAVCV